MTVSALRDGGRAVSLWMANIALTLAEQMDLRSFYQHKLGPKCWARGPELQQTDCRDLCFWGLCVGEAMKQQGCQTYCRHCFIE